MKKLGIPLRSMNNLPSLCNNTQVFERVITLLTAGYRLCGEPISAFASRGDGGDVADAGTLATSCPAHSQ